MKISWKWISEMVDFPAGMSPESLATLLTHHGLEVESVDPQARGLEQVVIVQIVSKKPHPQADRLSLCEVVMGEGKPPLEIVCGAQNMKSGDRVALAQVGATLPGGQSIQKSKIRGVVSHGMLCSTEELGLPGPSHEGILILPSDAPLGLPLAEYLGKSDTLLSLKLTANRGDCMSHWGVARETAALLGRKTTRKKALASAAWNAKSLSIRPKVSAGPASPKFLTCLIEGAKIQPSPAWLVNRLETLGLRSINGVVDATNLILHELGQPTHAYDADRLQGEWLEARMARAGEKIVLLDGKEIALHGSELVIADSARAVGLAGVMGGQWSEVRPETTRILLECALFDPVLIRKASTRHQLRTEAALRFEKGVDPEAQEEALITLSQLIVQLAGGNILGFSREVHETEKKTVPRIQVRPGFFQGFLGMQATDEECFHCLRRIGCEVRHGEAGYDVLPPSYRLDLNRAEDLAEEVARILSYDKIPETLPPLSDAPRALVDVPSWASFELIQKAKRCLSEQGLHETIALAFTQENLLKRLGLEAQVSVLNPLNEEERFLAPSLLPGLFEQVERNWRHHFGSETPAVRLFGIRPTFRLPQGYVQGKPFETGVQEHWMLSLVMSGDRDAAPLRSDRRALDFHDLKAVVIELLRHLGTQGARFQALGSPGALKSPLAQLLPLFHPGQSAELWIGSTFAGCLGRVHPEKQIPKEKSPLWIAEFSWEAIAALSRPVSRSAVFRAWPEFPPIERDFALLVRTEVAAEKIVQLGLKAAQPLAKQVKVFDVYRGSSVPEGMTSVAVRVIFYDEKRSLREEEIEESSQRMVSVWSKELGAELRGA